MKIVSFFPRRKKPGQGFLTNHVLVVFPPLQQQQTQLNKGMGRKVLQLIADMIGVNHNFQNLVFFKIGQYYMFIRIFSYKMCRYGILGACYLGYDLLYSTNVTLTSEVCLKWHPGLSSVCFCSLFFF